MNNATNQWGLVALFVLLSYLVADFNIIELVCQMTENMVISITNEHALEEK